MGERQCATPMSHVPSPTHSPTPSPTHDYTRHLLEPAGGRPESRSFWGDEGAYNEKEEDVARVRLPEPHRPPIYAWLLERRLLPSLYTSTPLGRGSSHAPQSNPRRPHRHLVAAHASTVSPSSVVGAARAAGIARPPTPLLGRPGSSGVRRPTVSASAPRFLAANRRYRQPEPPGPACA